MNLQPICLVIFQHFIKSLHSNVVTEDVKGCSTSSGLQTVLHDSLVYPERFFTYTSIYVICRYCVQGFRFNILGSCVSAPECMLFYKLTYLNHVHNISKKHVTTKWVEGLQKHTLFNASF